MKNKKLIVLIFLLLFTTGCSATYEVEIYNKKVNDKIEVMSPTLNTGESVYKYIEDLFLKYSGSTDVFLTRKFTPYDNNSTNTHSIVSKESYDNFKSYYDSLYFIKSCCRTIDFSDSGEIITYKALGYVKYFERYDELDSLKLVVKSNHKLVETNADEIQKGYVYIWKFDRSNYKSKIPTLKLYSNKYVFNYENEFVKMVLTIGGLAAIIVGGPAITYLVVKSKQKKANRI